VAPPAGAVEPWRKTGEQGRGGSYDDNDGATVGGGGDVSGLGSWGRSPGGRR
jgi:hypothetical protein